MSPVHLNGAMSQFALVSFIVMYITNDSKETQGRCVPGCLSWCVSKRSFTAVESTKQTLAKSGKVDGYSRDRHRAAEKKKGIPDTGDRRIKLGSAY